MLATTLGSLLLFLAAGIGVGLLLHGFGPGFATAGVDVASFALYIGIALSISAVPVLASIIQERALAVSPIVVVSFTSAALVDFVDWFALARGRRHRRQSAAAHAVGGRRSRVVVLLVVRPHLRRRYQRPVVSGGHRLAAVVTLAFTPAR